MSCSGLETLILSTSLVAEGIYKHLNTSDIVSLSRSSPALHDVIRNRDARCAFSNISFSSFALSHGAPFLQQWRSCRYMALLSTLSTPVSFVHLDFSDMHVDLAGLGRVLDECTNLKTLSLTDTNGLDWTKIQGLLSVYLGVLANASTIIRIMTPRTTNLRTLQLNGIFKRPEGLERTRGSQSASRMSILNIAREFDIQLDYAPCSQCKSQHGGMWDIGWAVERMECKGCGKVGLDRCRICLDSCPHECFSCKSHFCGACCSPTQRPISFNCTASPLKRADLEKFREYGQAGSPIPLSELSFESQFLYNAENPLSLEFITRNEWNLSYWCPLGVRRPPWNAECREHPLCRECAFDPARVCPHCDAVTCLEKFTTCPQKGCTTAPSCSACHMIKTCDTCGDLSCIPCRNARFIACPCGDTEPGSAFPGLYRCGTAENLNWPSCPSPLCMSMVRTFTCMDCPRQINITCFGANVFEEFGMRRKVYGYSKSRNLGPNNIDPIAEPSWVRQPELALDCHEEALRRTPYVRCAECHYYWLWRSIDLFTGGWNDSSDGRAQQHRQGDARAFRDTLIAANNVLPGI